MTATALLDIPPAPESGGAPRFCACGKPLGDRPRWCGRACAEKRREYHRRGGGASPEQIAASRARCVAWAVLHREVASANYWLRAAPPYDAHLPGRVTWLDLGVGRIPVERASALHGALCVALAWKHDRDEHHRWAGFSLFPAHSPSGWALWTPFDFRRLRAPQPVQWDGRHAVLRWGPLGMLKAPRVERRGRRRLRVDLLTPLIIRSMGGGTRGVEPTADNLRQTLQQVTGGRLGLSLAAEEVQVEVLDRQTQTDRSGVGFHGQRESGCVGHLLLEANATAHWLLACSERIGLAGRTSLGFGRIHLEALP